MACVLKPTIPYSIFQKHARGNCSDVRDLFVLKRCTWQLIPLTDSLCLAEPVCLSELLGMVVTPFISRSLSSAIKLTTLRPASLLQRESALVEKGVKVCKETIQWVCFAEDSHVQS
jgi:hypothetical protein